MSIAAYSMAHYGVDYAQYAWSVLEPFVDKLVVVYSASPSWTPTALACPDSKEQLFGIAQSVFGERLIWIENEQQSYDTVRAHVADADLILETDLDEVWQYSTILDVLRWYRAGRLVEGRYRVPMMHFWRSFNHVCRDGSWPVRLCVGGETNQQPMMLPFGDSQPIYHFGYARALNDMRYKIATSMHNSEWRPGWWERKFMRYPKVLTDLHPVSIGLWNAEPFDKRQLPAALHHHPYYEKAVIE